MLSVELTAIKDCVSEKIPVIMNDHPEMSQDQAIAVAFSMCGEGKSEEEATRSAADLFLFPGGAIKALGDGKIEGYLVVWGGPSQRDSYGEYFTPNTKFELDWYGGRRPVLFHHGLTSEKEDIGQIYQIIPDDTGLFARAQLDMSRPFVRQLYWNDVVNNKLGWSSGSAPNLTDTTNEGQILRWPIVEGSLTPSPAEPQRTTVSAVRSAITALSHSDPKEPDTAKEVSESENGEPRTLVGSQSIRSFSMLDINTLKDGLKGMGATPEQILEIISAMQNAEQQGGGDMPMPMAAEAQVPPQFQQQQQQDPEEDKPQKSDEAEADKAASTAAMVKMLVAFQQDAQQKALDTFRRQQPAPLGKAQALTNRFNPPGQSTQIKMYTRYHDMAAADMAHLYMLRKQSKYGQSWLNNDEGRRFSAELLDKTQKAIKAGEVSLGYVDDTENALPRAMAIKTDELNYSTLATGGDEWVPDLWSAELWKRMRLDNMVAPRIRVVEMPSNPFELPIESTDPTVYLVPETTNENQLTLADGNNPIPDSKVTTGKVTLTAKKLGLRVGFSGELEEDSIIPFIPELRTQAMRTVQDSIDNVLLNGDTATSLNINLDGGSPAATAKYLAFNGLLKLPIVTATTLSVNANGANPTLTHLRSGRSKLLNAYAADVSNLMWIVDFSTYMKLLAIDEVNSAANRGERPTSGTGILQAIDGIDLFVSNEMALADTDGKVTSGGNVVDRGRALLAYRPAWVVGYRRRVAVDLTYLPYFDSYQLTILVRLAFVNRDNQCSAVVYNLGI